MHEFGIHQPAGLLLVCGVLTGFALSAPPKKTQAQEMVERIVRKHSEIAELEVSATPDGQKVCVTIAATHSKDLGETCDEDEANALKTMEPIVERERDGFDFVTKTEQAEKKVPSLAASPFQTP